MGSGRRTTGPAYHLGEGGLRDEGEVGGGVPEVLVEAAGEGADEELVADLFPQITELIGELLEAHAKIIDGRVKLLAPVKLTIEEDLALQPIVGEEAVELGPDRIGVVLVVHHGVEEVAGDGEVEPADDGGVEDHPLLVVDHERRVHGAVHVAVQEVLTEHKRKIPLPSGVGRGVLIKLHRDTLMDVEVADEGDIGTGERVGDGGGGGTHG